MPKELVVPSDIVPGGPYRGGKANRIRIVDSLHVGSRLWVRCHSHLCPNIQHVSMSAFLKWAKEKL